MSVGSLSTRQLVPRARILFSASSSFSLVRAAATTARAPSRAASTASFTPRPGPIPDTITTLSLSSIAVPLSSAKAGDDLVAEARDPLELLGERDLRAEQVPRHRDCVGDTECGKSLDARGV